MNEHAGGDAIEKRREWRRSGRCASGSCVEVAVDNGDTPDAQVLIRDSKLGDDSQVIPLSRTSFQTFIDAVKRGELGPVK